MVCAVVLVLEPLTAVTTGYKAVSTVKKLPLGHASPGMVAAERAGPGPRSESSLGIGGGPGPGPAYGHARVTSLIHEAARTGIILRTETKYPPHGDDALLNVTSARTASAPYAAENTATLKKLTQKGMTVAHSQKVSNVRGRGKSQKS